MTEKINPADAIRLLDAHEAVAVDVREPDEYAVGHIPGAKLLPLGQVLTRAAEVLPDTRILRSFNQRSSFIWRIFIACLYCGVF